MSSSRCGPNHMYIREVQPSASCNPLVPEYLSLIRTYNQTKKEHILFFNLQSGQEMLSIFSVKAWIFYQIFRSNFNHLRKVINLGSDTFGIPIFQMALWNYPSSFNKRLRMLCLALWPRRKVRKLDFQNHPNLSEFFFIEE